MQREGISTLYIHGTPREPFHLIVCLSFENKCSFDWIDEKRRLFIIFGGFDRAVGSVPTYPRCAMRDQTPRSSAKNLLCVWLILESVSGHLLLDLCGRLRDWHVFETPLRQKVDWVWFDYLKNGLKFDVSLIRFWLWKWGKSLDIDRGLLMKLFVVSMLC